MTLLSGAGVVGVPSVGAPLHDTRGRDGVQFRHMQHPAHMGTAYGWDLCAAAIRLNVRRRPWHDEQRNSVGEGELLDGSKGRQVGAT